MAEVKAIGISCYSLFLKGGHTTPTCKTTQGSRLDQDTEGGGENLSQSLYCFLQERQDTTG